MVIDYKLGSSISMLDFEKELTLQAMIYAIAMNDLFGSSPVGAEYRPLKNWAPEGYYAVSSGVSKRNRTFDDQAFAAKLDLCKKIVLGIAQNIRLGRIAAEPKDCKSYCSFKGICRIDDYKLMKLKENGPQSEEAEL
jgi:ATP-dependent helicase/DNAse subunit B